MTLDDYWMGRDKQYADALTRDIITHTTVAT